MTRRRGAKTHALDNLAGQNHKLTPFLVVVIPVVTELIRRGLLIFFRVAILALLLVLPARLLLKRRENEHLRESLGWLSAPIIQTPYLER